MRQKVPVIVPPLDYATLVGFHRFHGRQRQLPFFFIRSRHFFRSFGQDITPDTRLMFTENQIIPSVYLYQFASLSAASFIDKHSRFPVYAFSVFRHLKKIGLITVCKMSPRKVSLSLIVPNCGTIIPTGFGQKRSQGLPRPLGTYGRGHEISFIRCPEKEVKTTVMVTQRPGPYPTVITVHACPIQLFTDLGQIFDSIPTDFPVHQILRM